VCTGSLYQAHFLLVACGRKEPGYEASSRVRVCVCVCVCVCEREMSE